MLFLNFSIVKIYSYRNKNLNKFFMLFLLKSEEEIREHILIPKSYIL